MEVTFVAFGPVREAVGRKEQSVDVPDGATVGDLLADLADEHRELDARLFEDGELRDAVTVTRNGKHLAHQDGVDTPLADGDVVRAAPPVKGG